MNNLSGEAMLLFLVLPAFSVNPFALRKVKIGLSDCNRLKIMSTLSGDAILLFSVSHSF